MQAYAVLIYGFLLIVGGLIGFAKSNSIASLVMGSVFGIISVINATAIFRGFRWGLIAALCVALFLGCFFGYRFFITQRFMPAGLLMIFSFVLAFFLRK